METDPQPSEKMGGESGAGSGAILIVLMAVSLVLVAGIVWWQLGIFNMGGTSATTSSMGYSAGGAKDMGNFRENIKHGYMPQPTDVTYEGLYYDYYFDTCDTPCDRLFCPAYSWAASRDPLSGYRDEYLSLGLNSNIRAEDFKRKKLNLVIVMDISGSMSSTFDNYYYDRRSPPYSLPGTEDRKKTKMQIANEAVVGLLGHLDGDDRLAIVAFDDKGYVVRDMAKVDEEAMAGLRASILAQTPKGGTNMEAGYRLATEMYGRENGSDPEEYENRIIMLTDAQPNSGAITEYGLLGLTERAADRGVHTTLIGIGVDFNSKLTEAITKIRGANYYSVHSSRQFKDRMDNEFEHMVTPMVYDLRMELESEGYVIEKVYGSPEANSATGRIMEVKTLFPSAKNDEGTRGGIIMIKLRRAGDDPRASAAISYEGRDGVRKTQKTILHAPDMHYEHHDDNGIRKAVLLARYADLLKSWMEDEREAYFLGRQMHPSVDYDRGIPAYTASRTQWERAYMPLTVSPHYSRVFSDFAIHYESEMRVIGDEELEKELQIIRKLANHDGSQLMREGGM